MALRDLRNRRAAWLRTNPEGNEQDWNHAHRHELVQALAEEEGDTQFLAAMQKADDYVVVNDALGGQYDLTTDTKGNINIKAKRFAGDEVRDRNIVNGILMAYDNNVNGRIVDQVLSAGLKDGMPLGDRQIRLAAERVLSGQAVSDLAGVGLRGGDMTGMSKEQRLLRAGDRMIEMDNGYDPVSGSLWGNIQLDGGHTLPHGEYPEYSDARWNMSMENKYVNRVKGKREGVEENDSYYNSLLNRLKKKETDDKYISPLQLANAWDVGG